LLHWSGVGCGWTRYIASTPRSHIRVCVTALFAFSIDSSMMVCAVATGVQHERAVLLALFVHPIGQLVGELVLSPRGKEGLPTVPRTPCR